MSSLQCIACVLAVLAVLFAVPSLARTDTEDNDDFRVNSSEPDDYQGAQEDIESNITDELAEKLRQFDEWAVENEKQSATGDAQGGASAGGSSGNGAANASISKSSPSVANGPEEAAPETSALTAGDEITNDVATDRKGDEVPQSSVPPPPRADNKAREDDVARMIREAAELETDPERKKALMEQYDAYLENS